MVKRNLIANYLGQGWRMLMNLAFIPLYIEYLGIEAWGIIGVFVVLQAWLALFDMGLKPTLARQMARFTGGAHDAQGLRDLLRTMEFITLAIAISIVLVIASIAEWVSTDWVVAENLEAGAVARAFVLMGFVLALQFLQSIYVSSINGLQRQVLQNVVTSTMATVRSVGAVVLLAWVAPTLEVFFLWQALVSLLTLCWMALAVYGVLPAGKRAARFSIFELKAVWRFAAGMFGITLLGLLLSQVDKVLLSTLLSLEAFGYYMLAANVAQTLNLTTGPIVNAFFPRFTELVARNDELRLAETYHLASQLISVLVGSLAILLIMFSGPLLHAWTGDAALVERTAPILSLLAFGTLLNRLVASPYRLQLAYGWTTLAVRINLVAVMVIVPLLFFAAPRYGALGAAGVWCLLNMGYVMTHLFLTHRRVLRGEARRWYVRDTLLPLMSALAVALLLRTWLPEDAGRLTTALALLGIGPLVLLTAALAGDVLRARLRALFGLLLRSAAARRSRPAS